jgi:hypothetical protein
MAIAPLTAPRRRIGPNPVERPCFVCGIWPGGHGIQVMAIRLQRTQRAGAKVIGTTLRVGLCARCLVEAIRDGRVPATGQLGGSPTLP